MRQRVIRALGHGRRRLFERLGSYRYSRPAALGIDRALERHLDFDGGFFIEAGANDGVNFSNTYWFERARGWTGLLVEGIPELARRCERNRPGSVVRNCALVAAGHPEPFVRMHYSNLQSIVEGAAHVEQGLRSQGERRTYAVDVPARTITSLLDELRPPRIDLFVLDVEGYEAQALRGLDLERHRPRYILVEALDLDAGKREIDALLCDLYEQVEAVTPHDFLYRLSEAAD
jgi:FkbM family methyltransferase